MVITAGFHHLMDSPGALRGSHDIEGVPYEFLPTPAYQGNRAGRILNMASLAALLPFHADRLARRYGRPSMVVASSPHPYVFATSHRVARRLGARSVFEVRDLWPLSLTELAGVRPSHPLVLVTERLERYAYTHADAVVSLLPETLSHMAERGLAPERWHYIPNGVDTHAPRVGGSSGEALTRALRWRADGRLVVVYAGALGAPNHVESLIEAIDLLHQRGEQRVVAIVVGRGERSSAIAASVVSKGLSDRVAIFDQIPKREIPTLLEACQVGYISLRPEPLFRFGVSPNKLFDYMLARLPVLFAIDAGNNPVAECDAGFSVSPGDIPGISEALASFSEMPITERVAMGDRGYEYVIARHSYDALAARYLELLDVPPREGT
ncbi:glycosyltransferase family 4 protein [Thauera sp. JM12B12]|uniref:glycosyltransferase family 4 protein n=1 Tax=Thauera sp. JM12B12 TaxID=3142262 RepID=UPI0031F39512